MNGQEQILNSFEMFMVRCNAYDIAIESAYSFLSEICVQDVWTVLSNVIKGKLGYQE